MDPVSFWRFRQKSDWFNAELYNYITDLLKQHCTMILMLMLSTLENVNSSQWHKQWRLTQRTVFFYYNI